MKKRKSSFVLMLLCVAMCATTVLAAAGFKSIRASINKNVTYYLNGSAFLRQAPLIMYNGTYYAPLDKVFNNLGYNISIDGNNVQIYAPHTKPNVNYPTKPNNPTITQIPTKTSNGVEIVAVDFGGKTITVAPENQPSNVQRQIRLTTDQETLIINSDGQPVKFTELAPGQIVNVTYGANLSNTVPRQSKAYKIVVHVGKIQPR